MLGGSYLNMAPSVPMGIPKYSKPPEVWHERKIPASHNPKHTAKITQESLKKKKMETMTWSPDSNPTEHLWGVLKGKMAHFLQQGGF